MKKIVLVGRAGALAEALRSEGATVHTLLESREAPLQLKTVEDELDRCSFLLLVSPYNGDSSEHLSLRKERRFLEVALERGVKCGIMFEHGAVARHDNTHSISMRVVTSVDEHAELIRSNPAMVQSLVLMANPERDARAVATAIIRAGA